MPAYCPFSIDPLSNPIGALIRGLDLTETVNRDALLDIRSAWSRYLVLVFEGQELTPAQQLNFARQLGRVIQYPMVQGLPDYPEIVPVVKLPHETRNFGGVWHSDTTYLPNPPSATLLLARELPPSGGDTQFANMYLAYDALSDQTKQVVNELTVIQSSAKPRVAKGRSEKVQIGAHAGDIELTAEHPVVRVHPVTGKRALYVNPAHSVRFKTMTSVESEPLLSLLFQHQINPEFIGSYRWQQGAMVLWDNRCVQHYPLNDYHGYKRVMHRITIA
jgi:taurine dioxygenase